MLDAVRNVCNQWLPASTFEMFAMQDQSGSLEPPMNSMLLAAAAASSSCNRPLAVERGSRTRPHPSQVLKCPRCDSLNTKFCYYNNYNLSQPRHFCKNCRRYWTKGGVLRNVPVGGGCRKNNHTKKSKPRNSSSAQRRNPPPAAKSTSNSTATVSSSESSPLTVTNIQETASSSTSLNSSVNTDRSNGYKFGSELQEILNGNYGYSNGAPDKCSMIPMPRLFNGHANLDYFLQELPQKQAPDLLNSGNLLSNIEANCSFSSLLGGSNFVGVSFSDIQSKLQQQKLAALNINEVEAPAPAAAQNAEVLTGNNYSNIIPLDWQVNSNNSEILLDDAYCWGAETETIWPDPATAQFTYPSGF